MSEFDLEHMTYAAFAAAAASDAPLVILLPVGSMEPHGPHLSLATDTVISLATARRAAARLCQNGVVARVAPAIPYGVTDCAAGFAGAVSVSAEILAEFLASVIGGYLAGGATHVCVINNHLEPGQDAAVRSAASRFAERASVACPLSRRWARTLTSEFKRGECHAGCYETSIVLAARPDLVNDDIRETLPNVPISLSEQLGAGVETFAEMGMAQAYAGDPAKATAAEGNETLDMLTEMVVTEVGEALNLSLGCA